MREMDTLASKNGLEIDKSRFANHEYNVFYILYDTDNGVDYCEQHLTIDELTHYLSLVLAEDYKKERRRTGLTREEEGIVRSALDWLLTYLHISDMLDTDALIEENRELIAEKFLEDR